MYLHSETSFSQVYTMLRQMMELASLEAFFTFVRRVIWGETSTKLWRFSWVAGAKSVFTEFLSLCMIFLSNFEVGGCRVQVDSREFHSRSKIGVQRLLAKSVGIGLSV